LQALLDAISHKVVQYLTIAVAQGMTFSLTVSVSGHVA